MNRPLGSPPPPLLLLAAAGAAALGVLAVVTGAGVVAVLAGLASVACAGLALRSPADPEPTSTPGGGGAAASLPVSPPPAEPAPHASSPTGPPAAPPGLLAGDFLDTTLRNRVAVARRALRPLSLLHFEVLELGDPAGKRPVDPEAVAAVLRATLREADTAAVVDESCYLCILEDTGEDGAVWTAERIRRNLADEDPGRRFRAGVASYPNHGLDADELRLRASTALDAARHWTRDRIEVATGT